MGKINVLGFEIANLIAAGEVVERPSSVLKELIENSIDSGADKIVAEIKHGGVSLIRVTDNGCGIEKDDLPVALKRHATSKISAKEDLNSITTLGFRGEALAAISSVSKMTVITKTKTAQEASMLTSEAGEIIDLAAVCAADGTTVVVSDLFYNVPARRKFLKKDATEAMNVRALVERVALSRPDISIQLMIDGDDKFHTPGNGDLKDTIYSIYGKDFTSKLIEAEGVANGIRVHGYIGRSDNVKKNRNLMNVFINGRFVKSITCQTAIEKAYTSYIETESFPTCVLFLDLNPSMVDVNVHPSKLEVKFVDERAVFETVFYTVKRALEECEYRPMFELESKKKNQNLIGAYVPIGADTKGHQISLSSIPPYISRKNIEGAEEKPREFENNKNKITDTITSADDIKSGYSEENMNLRSGAYTYSENSKSKSDNPYFSYSDCSSEYHSSTNPEFKGNEMTPKESIELLNKYRSVNFEEKNKNNEFSELSEVKEEQTEQIPDYKYVGEAFDCYVIVEYDGDLLIIDKHAAHERVIFEQLKARREKDGRIASQVLLLPITVILSPEEFSAVNDYRDEFLSVGFDFEINSESCNIKAIPDAISTEDAETLFIKMADELVSGAGNPKITEKIRREKALYQVACKAAIKGGRIYSREVIDWLVKKLLSIPDITVCPHGRPVAYRLTKNQLDRQFDRIK